MYNNAKRLDFMKRLIFYIPHQSVMRGRARCAAGARYSASLRSRLLTRAMSSGVGGLGQTRFRAVNATQRDPRLPPRVHGGR